MDVSIWSLMRLFCIPSTDLFLFYIITRKGLEPIPGNLLHKAGDYNPSPGNKPLPLTHPIVQYGNMEMPISIHHMSLETPCTQIRGRFDPATLKVQANSAKLPLPYALKYQHNSGSRSEPLRSCHFLCSYQQICKPLLLGSPRFVHPISIGCKGANQGNNVVL